MKSLGEEFKERKNELGITTEQLSRLSGKIGRAHV